MNRIAICLFGVLTALGATYASSAEYPTKSIRLVVPFAPGGGTDLLARLIAPRLGEVLGQQVVADNRGGAGSVIGTQMVANAAPDGYTLGFLDTAFAINPAIASSLPYNSEKDFATRMAEFGYDPTFIGPPGSRDYVFSEMRKWRKVMKESAVKVN